ncbi:MULTISPECIES: type II toxin-antitoxin system RelE/ParE family toxin [unclassified Lentimonas]|uniref:type II toxin-antitoxin system RelE/ParE family toxin n=1 Tax=unclassified Lentimonas TaxID=2630993 RepID=UPI001320D0C5|nr:MULTISPECIES: type II toxin-antitoxin system RelE/ParE family toxin [unclassified Lentimonas]CAA6678177.1 HigB toxin protein [Lentimonas sp. CC4]CAA6685933.1 HigB toxin protein [Lentimonas sp. CC6]CAA6691890.1 HigB toxin protein [Lentimonas sp. CC19]CAA6694634.1 HigB toxin protein [Lentimonas sp. CC10]CAA7072149.1 HigB toxin protein [Lentimonas sp. CC11]
MILSFADKETEKVFRAMHSAKLPSDIQRRAHNKLITLYASTALDALRIPPSNHLEALKGNRIEQHSIRINKQWRICFRWDNGNVHDVEITDYH